MFVVVFSSFFFFLYSARGGPAGLANKVTQHLGRIGRGGEPPFLGLGEPGAARFSTADSAKCWPGSAPRTAPGSAPRTAPGAGPAQHRGRRRLGSSRLSAVPPPPPLQWCSGPEEPGFPHRSLPSAGSRSGHQAGERGRGRGCRVAIGVVGLGGRGATLGKPGF